MRRTYRTGAAAAATATLLTGAGFAFASLREPVANATAPAAEVVSDTTPTAGPEDVEASLAELRDEAADLKAEIVALRKARGADATRDEPTPTATTSPATKAPAIDATTGASGAGGDEDEDGENGDDD